MDISRRNWLKLAAALAFGGRMPPGHAADPPTLLERTVPKTGEKVAAVGSPAPHGRSLGRSMSSIATSGTSGKVRMG